MYTIFVNGRFLSNDLYTKYSSSITEISTFITKNIKKEMLNTKKITNEKTFTSDNFEYYGDIIMNVVIKSEANVIFGSENKYKSLRNIYEKYYERNSVFSCILDKAAVNREINDLLELGCLILPLGGDINKLYKLNKLKDYKLLYADYFEAFVFGIFLQTYINVDTTVKKYTVEHKFNTSIQVICDWLNKLPVYKSVKDNIRNWFNEIFENNGIIDNSYIGQMMDNEYENCGYSIVKS